MQEQTWCFANATRTLVLWVEFESSITIYTITASKLMAVKTHSDALHPFLTTFRYKSWCDENLSCLCNDLEGSYEGWVFASDVIVDLFNNAYLISYSRKYLRCSQLQTSVTEAYPKAPAVKMCRQVENADSLVVPAPSHCQPQISKVITRKSYA